MFRFLMANPHTASGIFNLLYQSMIIFLAGLILLKIFNRVSAPVRSALSMTVLAAVLLLPFGILFFKSNDSVLQSISLPSIQQTYNHYLLNKESPGVQQPALQETSKQQSVSQVQETGDRDGRVTMRKNYFAETIICFERFSRLSLNFRSTTAKFTSHPASTRKIYTKS